MSTDQKITRNDTFSTENITLEKPKPTILEGNMQRLVQGGGSFVAINLSIQAKPTINYAGDYAAFVTYDQGSTIGEFSLKPPEYIINITYIVGFVVGIIGYIIGIVILMRRRYRRRVMRIQDATDTYTRLTNTILRGYDERVIEILPMMKTYSRIVNSEYFSGKLHRKDYGIDNKSDITNII
jgi:hypothetical protein